MKKYHNSYHWLIRRLVWKKTFLRIDVPSREFLKILRHKVANNYSERVKKISNKTNKSKTFQITNLMHNSFIFQQYVCYITLLNMFRAARCSKHVDERNVTYIYCWKIKELCTKLVIWKVYTMMHGQKNIKLTNLSLLEKEIKNRKYIRIVSHHPVLDLPCSHLPQESESLNYRKLQFYLFFRVWNFISLMKVRPYTEGIRGKGANKNIWT